VGASHLSSFPLEVTASSSLLRSRNGQCHSKFYACAAAVRTSEFAFLVVLLRESLQKAFVAILADELVMRHTTLLRSKSESDILPLQPWSPSCYLFDAQLSSHRQRVRCFRVDPDYSWLVSRVLAGILPLGSGPTARVVAVFL
jgi:hypothetical protein